MAMKNEIPQGFIGENVVIVRNRPGRGYETSIYGREDGLLTIAEGRDIKFEDISPKAGVLLASHLKGKGLQTFTRENLIAVLRQNVM